MPPQTFHQRKKAESDARRAGVSIYKRDFIKRVNKDKNRLAILMEGDSWFDYPPKYLIAGRNRNISKWMMTHVVKNKGFANIISLAKNGDTLNRVTSPPGSNDAIKILDQVGSKIDFILVSAGGNDIVGRSLQKFTSKYEIGFSANDCVNENFDKRVEVLAQRYEEVLSYLKRKSSKSKVITHPYCYLKPSPRGFKLFLWRIGDGWIYPYLEKNDIPEELHKEMVIIMIDKFFNMLKGLEGKFDNFFVIDTRRGVLDPESHKDWTDEMHPTESGFKRLTKLFVEKMHELDGRVPLME